jgi:predicted nucleic acid-binding protein
MSTLVDTGILLRAFDANSSNYRMIRRALRKALDDGEPLIVTVQSIAEFWNVATRPLANNGQGLIFEKAKRRIEIIERICHVISEDNRSFTEWKRLVEKFAVIGVAAHDARLVSVMLVAGVKRLLTLNERDFSRYAVEGISVETPELFVGRTN